MSNTVENQIAQQVLNQFHVSLGLNIQAKLTDWQGRQQTQYGAIKGLLNKDWHSLADFKIQLQLYSNTSRKLRIAYAVIKSLIPNNAKLQATLINIPGFGYVGQQILSLSGINGILLSPQDILTNTKQFNNTVSAIKSQISI